MQSHKSVKYSKERVSLTSLCVAVHSNDMTYIEYCKPGHSHDSLGCVFYSVNLSTIYCVVFISQHEITQRHVEPKALN